MKTPSLKKTEAFLAFHKKHPHLRFFQALLSFTKYSRILVEHDGGEVEDTFYFEDK